MSKKIAKFEKVSYDQWVKDMAACGHSWVDEDYEFGYNGIMLPDRATSGSAGYDFKAPFDFTLYPGETITIPTGIRCKMDDGWCLVCLPKSGHGFKYRAQLDNTIGLIDSDYYYSDNEGHIMARITNDGHEGKEMTVTWQKGFMQGVFLQYGIVKDDNAEKIRNGGFGSTDN